MEAENTGKLWIATLRRALDKAVVDMAKRRKDYEEIGEDTDDSETPNSAE
jgi:hypothetical protein